MGLVLAWIIGGYAIGRGLFAAVAMRRMPRPAAEALYRRARPAVLTQGCILALAGTIPVLNLLIPVIGTAAMVHVLDQVLVAACRSLWITLADPVVPSEPTVLPRSFATTSDFRQPNEGAGVQTSQA